MHLKRNYWDHMEVSCIAGPSNLVITLVKLVEALVAIIIIFMLLVK